MCELLVNCILANDFCRYVDIFIIENNIDTIYVTTNTVLKTYMAIYKVERYLK